MQTTFWVVIALTLDEADGEETYAPCSAFLASKEEAVEFAQTIPQERHPVVVRLKSRSA